MSNKLLILDIDETLLHTTVSFNGVIFDNDFSFKSDNGATYYVKKRPHLDELLDYAFNNFKVAVWTAGSQDYADTVLSKCGIYLPGLQFLWARDRCTIKINYELGLYYGLKNLNKVRKIGWNLNDILIVDDVKETAALNYGNLINIKGFYDDKNDIELLKLIKYLDKIKDEPNYRRIEKRGWSNQV